MGNPTFKSYYQDQLMAFPPSLEEMVPKNHTVRVANDIINQINLDVLIKEYECRGRVSYHPSMLLKVIIYGYINNIYSSRKLELECVKKQ